MLMMGDGTLNSGQLEALLLMINSRFFKGLGAFLKVGKSKEVADSESYRDTGFFPSPKALLG